MTTYFVTGATGFLGRNLISRLLRRDTCDRVYALVRPFSLDRLDAFASTLPQRERLVPVHGDLTEPGLGLSEADLRRLSSGVDHVIHLGAVYDLTSAEQLNAAVNVRGTQHVIDLSSRIGAGCLHHVSSIAVAGQHRGPFTEQDFDLGQRFGSPYHSTKFAAEKLVREQELLPWRVYRPSAVVGDSRTGEIDKIDGPYYLFPALSRLGRLPSALPLATLDLGATNIVPVDYVTDAMDYLIHADTAPNSTFHLVAPQPQSLSEVYNALAKAAGAPRLAYTAPARISAPLVSTGRRGASALGKTLGRVPGAKAAAEVALGSLGIPAAILPHLSLSATFESTATQRALAGSGLRPPALNDYVDVLWKYWSEHLDPFRARRRQRGGPLAGRRIMITGASSGIGLATALAVAKEGGIPLLVARRADELEQVRQQIAAGGGTAFCYPCDLTDDEAVEAMLKQVLGDHDGVDMLVNNAGRSIRRSVRRSTDRLHDFERTMAINYFGPVRLVLGLLPHMERRRFGHIVNISSQGVQLGTPRFSAYLASKSALDAFSRVAAAETLGSGVTFTTVYMPLVRTPMITPTTVYRGFPASSPEQAAALVVTALVKRPKRVSLPFGRLGQSAYAVAPKLVDTFLHLGYRLMPGSPAATEAKHLDQQDGPSG